MRPPEDWRRARVTLAIAAATVFAWVAALPLGPELPAVFGGFIPARASGLLDLDGALPAIVTPLSATLIHAGLLHLLFNLLIHAFCGRAVENIIGGRALALLYVAGAYSAAAAQWAWEPDSAVPMVGASGAISAILGAYAMLFGRNRVRIADPRAALLVNALWLGAGWIGLQLLVGLSTSGAGPQVAVAAHIGGFLAGLLLARPLLLLRWRGA